MAGFPDCYILHVHVIFACNECTANILHSYYSSFSPAEAPEDYIRVVHQIIFNNYSVNPHRLYIPIVNDECVEQGRENFFVHISTSMDCVALRNEYVEVTIIDDDGRYIWCY